MFRNIDTDLLDEIVLLLNRNKSTISIAESCTGGFLSSCFVSKSGASNYFKGSLIAYSNDIKQEFLSISSTDINSHGIVSKYVVELMANNIRKKYTTDFGLATTGYLEKTQHELCDAHHLHAWIAIASHNFIISERIFLDQSRCDNMSHVAQAVLSLFIKQIR